LIAVDAQVAVTPVMLLFAIDTVKEAFLVVSWAEVAVMIALPLAGIEEGVL